MADPPLSVECACETSAWEVHAATLERALAFAAEAEGARGVVALLLSNDAALAALNQRFRDKAGPTNVLSFPAAGGEEGFLGDIAMAFETIAREASEQGKTFENHAAHLAVHGLLHLLGYDHLAADDAEIMEAREREILARLGVADPYAELGSAENVESHG